MGALKDLNPKTYGSVPSTWPDWLVVAATIFGEARGESMEVKVAVGLVIRKRVQDPRSWWGVSFKTVCLKAKQFSCWNEDDPNRVKCLNPLAYASAKIWADCIGAASLAMETKDPKTVSKIRHCHSYYDISMDEKGLPPVWADSYALVEQVGRIKFFSDKV